MSSKIINIVLFSLLSLCITHKAIAGLIIPELTIGDLYSDDAGIQWEYVGSFELADGPIWKDAGLYDAGLYNGLEVAEIKFGSLSEGTYALSTFLASDIISDKEGYGVNHMAWYDTFEGGSSDGIAAFDENLSELDKGGDNTKYDSEGDITAYVKDRSRTYDELFNVNPLLIKENALNINYVFKSVTTVPEPTTLAIFSLALIGLVSRRIKKQ